MWKRWQWAKSSLFHTKPNGFTRDTLDTWTRASDTHQMRFFFSFTLFVFLGVFLSDCAELEYTRRRDATGFYIHLAREPQTASHTSFGWSRALCVMRSIRNISHQPKPIFKSIFKSIFTPCSGTHLQNAFGVTTGWSDTRTHAHARTCIHRTTRWSKVVK